MRLRECLLQAAAKGKRMCAFTNKGYGHDSKPILDVVNTSECKHDMGRWSLVRNARQELVVVNEKDATTYYGIF